MKTGPSLDKSFDLCCGGEKNASPGSDGSWHGTLFSLLWILSSQLSCQRWISPCLMPPGWKYLMLNTSLQQKETKQVFAPLGVTWFMLPATAEFLYERLYFLSLCPAYGSVTQLLLFYFYIERWQLVGIFPQFASVAFHVSTVWMACVVSKAGRWFFPLCFIRSVTETSLKAVGEVGGSSGYRSHVQTYMESHLGAAQHSHRLHCWHW